MSIPATAIHSGTRDIVRTSQRIMKAAGLDTKGFNADQSRHFFSQQCAELAKKIHVVAEGCLTPNQKRAFRQLAEGLEFLNVELTQGLHQGDIMRADHAELMAADFAMAMASTCSIFSVSNDGEGAVSVGCRALMDQFVADAGGELHLARDDKGQAKVRDGWKAPDFGNYVDKMRD